MSTTKTQRPTPIPADLPIVYHHALEETFDGHALDCGWKPARLRAASEKAIRTRHHRARIEHESHRANGLQPNVYNLRLGVLRRVRVYYTVERAAVVIRGYGWHVANPLDDWDGGGFFCDNAWLFPSKEAVRAHMELYSEIFGTEGDYEKVVE